MNPDLTYSATLDSCHESVEEFEAMARRFSRDAGFDEDDQYFIGLAAREIVTNAIKHGNLLDPDKKVGVRLSKNADRIAIEVTDEGEGFCLANVPDPRAPENLERRSGRGLAITMSIMDEFSVNQNVPRGTHIRMSKLLPKP